MQIYLREKERKKERMKESKKERKKKKERQGPLKSKYSKLIAMINLFVMRVSYLPLLPLLLSVCPALCMRSLVLGNDHLLPEGGELWVCCCWMTGGVEPTCLFLYC